MNIRKRSSRRAPRRKARGGASPLIAFRPAPDDPPFLEFWKRANGTLPEKIKEADLRTLNSGLGFLFDRLRQAQARFEQEGEREQAEDERDASHELDDQRASDIDRQSFFSALGAFWSFITLFRGPLAENLHAPILRLQNALLMLDRGQTDPILEPARRSGRGFSSEAHASLRANAAVTVRLLQQAGLTRDDAHTAVASELRRLGVRSERGSGTVKATTVRNWCDEVARAGRDATVSRMYEHKFARQQAMLSEIPKDQVRQSALDELAYWIGKLFPELRKAT